MSHALELRIDAPEVVPPFSYHSVGENVFVLSDVNGAFIAEIHADEGTVDLLATALYSWCGGED